MNKTKKEFDEILNIIDESGISAGELFQYKINDEIERFKELTKWTLEHKDTYNKMLKDAIDVHKKIKNGKRKEIDLTTREIGDLLENLVNFIIERTYFFEVVSNVKTRTNEIDQLIKLSKRGKQAIENYGISRSNLIIKDDYFLGECKNYDSSIGVTWVGKFYGLLKSCDCNFGIIFSFEELTGQFNKWKDAQGLIRTFTLIEKHKYDCDFFIIDFGLEDFEKIGEGESFFDIIEAKIDSIRIGANYTSLVEKYKQSVDSNKNEFIKQVEDYKKSSIIN